MANTQGRRLFYELGQARLKSIRTLTRLDSPFAIVRASNSAIVTYANPAWCVFFLQTYVSRRLAEARNAGTRSSDTQSASRSTHGRPTSQTTAARKCG